MTPLEDGIGPTVAATPGLLNFKTSVNASGGIQRSQAVQFEHASSPDPAAGSA